MRDIFALEKNTEIARDNSYIISYPQILSHFGRIAKFSDSDFVICSHIVYGWMPTGLDLYVSSEFINFGECARLLNDSRQRLLTTQELESLSKVVNNSLVGTSKLLHFSNPDLFPIWDSKIYSFIHNEPPYDYRVKSPEKYLDFVNLMSNMKQKDGFSSFHKSVNTKLNYDVSAVRAVELIMFLNSTKYDG